MGKGSDASSTHLLESSQARILAALAMSFSIELRQALRRNLGSTAGSWRHARSWHQRQQVQPQRCVRLCAMTTCPPALIRQRGPALTNTVGSFRASLRHAPLTVVLGMTWAGMLTPSCTRELPCSRASASVVLREWWYLCCARCWLRFRRARSRSSSAALRTQEQGRRCVAKVSPAARVSWVQGRGAG